MSTALLRLLLLVCLYPLGAIHAQEDAGPETPLELPELLDGLFSRNAGLRSRCYQALKGYGLDVLPEIAARLLRDSDTAPYARAILQAYTEEQEAQDARSTERGAAVDSFLGERLLYARGRLEAGDHESALAVVDAILELAPQGAVRTRANALRRQARDAATRATIVKGEIVTAGTRFALNELVEVQLRLKNESDSRLLIPERKEQEGQVAESLVVVNWVYRIYDPAGNLRSFSDSRQIDLEEDIDLPPGGVWTTSFILDPAENNPDVQAVRTYTFGASVRPVEIQVGAETLFRRLPFPGHEIQVFPLGWERVAAEPLNYIARFLDQGFLHHLAVSSWLVPDAAKRDAIDMLVAALATTADYESMVIMSCLERLTGEDRGRDPPPGSTGGRTPVPPGSRSRASVPVTLVAGGANARDLSRVWHRQRCRREAMRGVWHRPHGRERALSAMWLRAANVERAMPELRRHSR